MITRRIQVGIERSRTRRASVVIACSVGLALLVITAWFGHGRSGLLYLTDRVAVAPDLVVTAVSGEPLRLADTRGEPVALFFFCGCHPCREVAGHLDHLAARLRHGRIWGLSEMSPADIRVFARDTVRSFPLASDPGGDGKQAFGVVHCPTVILVDPWGRVRDKWSPRAKGRPDTITGSRLRHMLEAGGVR
jgi:peroxiredoxin